MQLLFINKANVFNFDIKLPSPISVLSISKINKIGNSAIIYLL
jgi:hypothetical protein